MLNTRDAHNYPLQGYGFVPKRIKPEDTLSELVKLLQQANERVEELKDNVQYWSHKYHSLCQEHMAIKYGGLCKRCQTIRDTTPPGDTITVCTNCTQDKDTTAGLWLKLENKENELCYWQGCYERLLQQHFEDDRRGYDGTHERV